MQITLKESMFTNNRLEVAYGNNQTATFILIDEEFAGDGKLGKISKVLCVTDDGESQVMNSLVIGLGNEYVGVSSGTKSLLGKVLNKDNMSSCIVELYEDE